LKSALNAGLKWYRGKDVVFALNVEDPNVFVEEKTYNIVNNTFTEKWI